MKPNEILSAAQEYYTRKCETRVLFRPWPKQEEVLQCTARELLIRGGNRSSKTTISAFRFASIAMDRPLYNEFGDEIHCRLPHQRGKRLLMWIIGYQTKHIGQTIHRVLFRPGLINIIKDENTGLFRTYKPWDAEDKKRKNDAKPAPPLIPPRYIDPRSWSWENKGAKVFENVTIINPETGEPTADICAYTSTGEPKAGDPVDDIWIDEHIAYPSHYAEWQARIIDKEGRICWSSWPRTSNNALRTLSERAAEAAEEGKSTPKEYVFTMSGNKFLSDKAKEEAIEGWHTEEERRARDTGEFVTDQFLIYPLFDKYTHCAVKPESVRQDMLSEFLREHGGNPGKDWTRELILDPGTSRPAILFGAIPPPEFGDYLVCYDEIFIPRLTADQLAELAHQKAKGQWFNRFIIDGHASRQTPMGAGETTGAVYSRAFDKHGLRSAETGTHFIPGSDNFMSRSAMVDETLVQRRDGTTRLRVVVEKCPNLCRQMATNVKVVQDLSNEKVIKDEPARQVDDLRVCLEYWISRRPIWVPVPEDFQSDWSPAYEYWNQKFGERRRKAKEQESVHIGIGPAPQTPSY